MKRSQFKLDTLQVRFLLSKKVNGIKEVTLESYRKIFMNFEHQTERPMDYDNLLEQTADFFYKINWYSDMAFNNQRAHLNCYFNFLIEEEILKANPIKELKITRRKEDDQPKPTCIEELEALLAVIPSYSYVGKRDRTMILLMADTGIRPAEAVRLKVSHVDLQKGYIFLTKDITKTKKDRITPISSEVKNSLVSLREIVLSQWENKDHLFLTEDGEEMETHVLRNNMKRYSKLAGVKVTPYQLRHFFGTEYLRHEGNLLYLQKVMGHSNLNTTKKYIQIDENDLLRSHKTASPIKGLIRKKNTDNQRFRIRNKDNIII